MILTLFRVCFQFTTFRISFLCWPNPTNIMEITPFCTVLQKITRDVRIPQLFAMVWKADFLPLRINARVNPKISPYPASSRNHLRISPKPLAQSPWEYFLARNIQALASTEGARGMRLGRGVRPPWRLGPSAAAVARRPPRAAAALKILVLRHFSSMRTLAWEGP